jgi:hypothetical protein
MAAHVGTQPVSASGVANKSFISALNILDRSFTPELVEKYGNENYTFILDLIGRKVKVENNEFYHYEGRRRPVAVQVATDGTAAAAGADASLTIAAGSHSNSGTKTPGRVGEVVMVSQTGVLGKITAINTTTPSAHVYTVKPLRSTDAFTVADNDWILFQGAQHVGEGSTKISARQPLTDKVTNTVTQIREDYEITDLAGMERIEWSEDGNHYYKYKGTKDAEKAFMNSREKLTMFSVPVTNTGITSNGTVGTKGLLNQVQSGGSDLGYTSNSMTLADIKSVIRELTFNGVSSEIHALQDVYQFQEMQTLLFSTYNQGAILWATAGGSKEIALTYGFSSFTIEGFTFHFKKYAGFTPEWEYGVTPASAHVYKNYSLFLPQGFSTDGVGKSIPTIALRYMEPIPGVEVNAYETGGLALVNKTDEQVLRNHMIGHYGVQVAAANKCLIFNGS